MYLTAGPWLSFCTCSNLFVLFVYCGNEIVLGYTEHEIAIQSASTKNVDITPVMTSSVEIRPIIKRRVKSRKGVPQSSDQPWENDTSKTNSSTIQENQSVDDESMTGSRRINTSTLTQGKLPHFISNMKFSSVPKPSTNHSTTAVIHQKLSTVPYLLNSSSITSLNQSSSTSELNNVTANNERETLPRLLSSTARPWKKSKPGVTFDLDDLPKDDVGNIYLPEEGLVSAEPSADFVVPVVISLLVLPVVVLLGTLFYKRGRDFWDRRHYRRMDFLIEGMYNE